MQWAGLSRCHGLLCISLQLQRIGLLPDSVFLPERLCFTMSFRKKDKAKRQREEGIYKEEVKTFVMDEWRKQFAIEVVESLPLVLVGGKHVVDYSGAAKILVERSGGFQSIMTAPARILTCFWSCFQIFSTAPPHPPETLKLGQTSGRNFKRNLKIGGYHVSSPCDRLFLTQRSPSFRAPFPPLPSPFWAPYIYQHAHLPTRVFLRWRAVPAVQVCLPSQHHLF